MAYRHHWLALLRDASPAGSPSEATVASQQHALGCWALQFTPRVALLEEAVVAEVGASLRLFGGAQALRERMGIEAAELGWPHMAWADNSLAALALARCGVTDGFAAPLPALLDALPLRAVSAVAAHQASLERLGCRTLGEVRRLPRAGLSLRLGGHLLNELDKAYGLQPVSHDWLCLPDVFDAQLELPERVEHADALLAGAQRLLRLMQGWLAARRAGLTTFTLSWVHSFHRTRHVPSGDGITIRTADVSRDVVHWVRLLSEHLRQCSLQAPVDALRLQADTWQALPDHTSSLLPDEQRQGDSLQQLLERLSARLGEDKVLMPQWHADHRPECVQHWQPAHRWHRRMGAAHWPDLGPLPQPTWLLRPPVRLMMRQERPVYQGALQIQAGPYRIESGWWDQATHAQAASALRDYFLAFSERAGLLWIYRERVGLRAHVLATAADDEADPVRHAWYLHGVFA
jgi:protein ImuB